MLLLLASIMDPSSRPDLTVGRQRVTFKKAGYNMKDLFASICIEHLNLLNCEP